MTDQDLVVAFASGLSTGLGGLLAAISGRAGAAAVPALLGLSSGIGFTLVFFNLLPGAVSGGSWLQAGAGFLSGMGLGRAGKILFPRPGKCWLFALGVAMHNLPGGMAVGAGLEAGGGAGGLLAAAAGLHNVPEGMALGGVLALNGLRPWASLAATTGAGLMMPLGTLLAGLWMAALPGIMPFILAAGAGMLLHTILAELIPESCRRHPVSAGAGMVAGAALSLLISLCL